MIDYFSDHIIWGGFIPCELRDENDDIIAPTGGRMLEFGLINNESIPWSIDFLHKYENKLEFKALVSNPDVWQKAFQQHFNHDMLSTIMSII